MAIRNCSKRGTRAGTRTEPQRLRFRAAATVIVLGPLVVGMERGDAEVGPCGDMRSKYLLLRAGCSYCIFASTYGRYAACCLCVRASMLRHVSVNANVVKSTLKSSRR